MLWSIALVAIGGFVLFSVTTSRDQLLESPEQYLDRVLGRDLDAAELTSRMPRWQRLLNASDTSTPGDALKDAIDTYQHFHTTGVLAHNENVARTLAILLGEAGQIDEAEAEVKQLSDDEANAHFGAAFRAAYLVSSDANRRSDSDPVLRDVSPQWARDKLEWRLADRRGDEPAVRQVTERVQSRGRHLQDRISLICLANLLLIASGLAVIGGWLRRHRPALAIGLGVSVSPWALADGYAMLVRAGVMGIIVAGGLTWLSDSLRVVNGCATLLSAAPMFWLARRSLLIPPESGFRSCFGLRLESGKLGHLARWSMAVLAVMILGEMALAALTARLDSGSLTESIPEDFLFGTPAEVVLSSIDAVIWAPLIEEIAFRGLLYTTLRRRLPVPGAAAASSAIFGLVHGYSLQGFLIICWSGFLWALVYEKSRSLWPSIICHGVSNALALISPILVYRW